MRTNYSGFALAVSMGLIVLLIGFLALSAAGLTSFGLEPIAEGMPAFLGTISDSVRALSVNNRSARPEKLATPEEADAIAAGDALFKNNCAQCHAVTDKIVGPALSGITKRRTLSWIVKWVHNSTKVIASGDGYAVKLYDEYGKQQMPAFPQLSDKEIRDIIAWMAFQEGKTAIMIDDRGLTDNTAAD